MGCSISLILLQVVNHGASWAWVSNILIKRRCSPQQRSSLGKFSVYNHETVRKALN